MFHEIVEEIEQHFGLAGTRPWMVSQRWRHVMLAHWPVPPEVVRGLVPEPLEIDTYAGGAWVSAVAMKMVDLHLRDLPPVPGTSDFPELNLRTYVRHGGRAGVYFFSIDAPGWLTDHVAQLVFDMPYLRADATLATDGDHVQFDSRRLDAGSAAFVAHYGPLGPAYVTAPGSLDHFLSERYSAFAVARHGAVMRSDLRHAPWQLRPAEVAITRNTVAQAASFDLPAAPARVHLGETDAIAWLPVVESRGDTVPASEPDPDAERAAIADATRRVDDIAGDPDARFRLRFAFYHHPGAAIAPFGSSELAFLRWEIQRGVLAQAGSAWWRAVNRGLLIWAEAALALHQRGTAAATTPEVARWLEFLRAPSPVRWYRAHNASIVRGYLDQMDLARSEHELEQRLITIILSRVLLAQALVDPPAHHGSSLEHELEQLVADPRLPAVDVLVHVPDLYPGHYPLVDADAAAVLDRLRSPEGILVRFFDRELVIRHQVELYEHVAEVLAIPELMTLVQGGVAHYPL